MKRLSVALVVSFSLLGSCAALARADLVGWSYDGGEGAALQVSEEGSPDGSGPPAVIGFRGAPLTRTAGAQRVPFASVLLAAYGDGVYGFGPPNNTLSLPLRITDALSGASATVNFNVSVTGSLQRRPGDLMDPEFVTFDLRYSVANPTPPPLLLGGNTYAVTFAKLDFGSFAGNAPDHDVPGAVYADVTVMRAAPEPAGWALACAGLGCVALAAAGRRLRRPRVA